MTNGAQTEGKSSTGKKILMAAGGCLLLVMLCCLGSIGYFFIGKSSVESDATARVDEFLQAMRTGEIEQAYQMTDRYYQTSTTADRFRSSMAERCIELMGHATHEVRSVKVDHPFDDFVIVRVDISGGRLESTNQMSIGLQNEDGEWKIGTLSNRTSYGCSLL